MKKLFLILSILLWGSVVLASARPFLYGGEGGTGTAVTLDTTNFNTNLSAADNTVQKMADTLDEVAGGTGAPTTAHYLVDQAETGLSAEVVVTTVGKAVATLTNPSAITFPRFNADNTVTALSAANFLTAIGGQAADADLTIYAGITPSANIQTLLGSADFSAARTNLGLAIGTNVQAYDADLTTWGGVTPGTGNATALAINVGTAGAFLPNNAAATGLGAITSSGTITSSGIFDVTGAAQLVLGSADVLSHKLSGISEDLVFTPSADLWTIASTTGALITITPAVTFTSPIADASIADTITVGASGSVNDAAIPSGITRDTEVRGAAYGGTGIANNAASTLTISGNYATTLTVTDTTGVTLPTSGTLATTAQLHNAVTLGSGIGGLTLSTQELGLSTRLEGYHDYTDPDADRLWFWDDSESAFAGLTLGTNLSITGTTINAAGAGTGSVTTVKEAGSQIGGADIVTLDFGAGFDGAEDPDTEINITLDLTEYTGAAIGSTSGEITNIYMGDSAVIYGQADQSNTLTSSATAWTANGDIGIGDDLLLSSTGSIINFYSGDVLITHGANTLGFTGATSSYTFDDALDITGVDGLILSNDETITNGTDGLVETSGDFKITGDDLYMTTNTSGAILVADGTNFNPVVMSGDASIGTDGVVTVANDSHTHGTSSIAGLDFGDDIINGTSIESISGLTEADVSILEATADNAYAVVTSGGNNYMVGSNSNNTALEFKTPANVLSEIGAAPLASPALTGDPILTDPTPTLIRQDSDTATGTAADYANSSGGAYDIIWILGVEDSAGENTPYIELDGVSETVDLKKNLVVETGIIQTGNVPLVLGDSTTDSASIITDDGTISIIPGTNTQYDNPLTAAPQSPVGGRDYIEDCANWDSASLSIDKTGSSNISFDLETKTITGAGSNDGYTANMVLKVASTTNNNGTFTIASVGATTIVVNESLVDEDNTSAALEGGYPYKVRYNDVTTSYVLSDNINGDVYISGFDNGAVLTVDGTYSGTTITMTVDASETNTSFGQAYHVDTDGELVAADADATTTAPAIGLAAESGVGSTAIILSGQICETDWNWTIGGLIYLSIDPTTTEGLSQTAVSGTGDQGQIIGIALSADTILVQPNYILVEVE